MKEKKTFNLDYIRRGLPFGLIVACFVMLAYGYGEALAPIANQEKSNMMRICGVFMP